MSVITLKTKTVDIRKTHRCQSCWNILHPPAIMRYQVQVIDSDFIDFYTCNICYEFEQQTPDFWNFFDDEMYPGDIWEHPNYKVFRSNYNS